MSDWPGSAALLGWVAWLRYLLLGLAVAWALALARRRRLASLALGVIFAATATGFWTLSLARPYGLLEDADTTRRAAEVAVAAATGRAGESFLADEPAAFPAYAALLRTGLGAGSLRRLPSFLPPLVLAAIGLLVATAWRRREDAVAGASLWLVFSTGELEAARGFGFLSGLWSRPEAALMLPPLAALALVAGRLPSRRAFWPAAVCALGAVAAPAPVRAAGTSLGDAVLVLTLDQGPWLLLGAAGLLRVRDASALGLVLGGAAGVGLAALPGGPDPWACQALFRLGLLLAAATLLRPWLCEAGEWLAERGLAPARSRPAPELVGLALLVLLGAPGSFVAWWDPVRSDEVARASQEPISPVLEAPMAFLRGHTPAGAVVLASPDYAPVVAVFAGRRVLRAPSLARASDEERRLRAEGALLAGRPIPPGAADHGVGFVLIAPGDFRARGIHEPADLDGRSGLRLRYSDPAGFRVYEVVR